LHGFTLDAEDMAALIALNKPDGSGRYCVPCIEVEGKLVHRDAKHPHYPFNEPW